MSYLQKLKAFLEACFSLWAVIEFLWDDIFLQVFCIKWCQNHWAPDMLYKFFEGEYASNKKTGSITENKERLKTVIPKKKNR